MRRPSARLVIGTLAISRVVIGLAFAAAPSRLRRQESEPGSDLMTRSFAVREIVLGVGALGALAKRRPNAHGLQLWASLGSLVDLGDLTAALITHEPGAGVAALFAAAGLSAESWALWAASQTAREVASSSVLRPT